MAGTMHAALRTDPGREGSRKLAPSSLALCREACAHPTRLPCARLSGGGHSRIESAWQVLSNQTRPILQCWGQDKQSNLLRLGMSTSVCQFKSRDRMNRDEPLGEATLSEARHAPHGHLGTATGDILPGMEGVVVHAEP